MRTPVCAGNWKMNPPTLAAAETLARALVGSLDGISSVDLVVCPPAVYLSPLAALFTSTSIHAGAQNAHWADSGAFTGETSPAMLVDLASFVIIGHSERRAYFGETDETVNTRTAAALRHGLRPITCVGETLDEREGGRTGEVLRRQVRAALTGIDLPEGFVIAYEPVWAIGTGRAATDTIAEEAIGLIRDEVASVAGTPKAETVRILYGGSVTAANAAEFMHHPGIDGALIGGASLKADEFAAIARAMSGRR